MWYELFIEYNGPSLLCEFIAYYTKATDKNLIRVLKIKNETQRKLSLPEMPFLIIESKEIVRGEVDICKFITRLTGTFELFFGKTQEVEDRHMEFIKEFNLSADYLPYLNNHLMTRTFCNGNNITISDFYAFSFVIQEVYKLHDDKKFKFCNVIRWVDHIQNLNGLKDQLERLKFMVSLPFEPLLLEPKIAKLPEKKSKPEHKEQQHENVERSDPDKIEKPVTDKTEKSEKTENKNEGKKDEKKNKEAKPQPKKKDADEGMPAVSRLDFRVGKIIEIDIHSDPEATHLFCEKVDIGNGEIRTIASGLRGKIPIENLKNKNVVVLCNLKARNLKGFNSHGMVITS